MQFFFINKNTLKLKLNLFKINNFFQKEEKDFKKKSLIFIQVKLKLSYSN